MHGKTLSHQQLRKTPLYFHHDSRVQLEQHIFFTCLQKHGGKHQRPWMSACPSPPFTLTLCQPSRVPQSFDITGISGPVKKKPLINIYKNCFCQPSLSVMSRNSRVSAYLHLAESKAREPSACPPPGAKSKELREAHVNNCKPIKITLHLSCDFYWFAFQFSSVRPSDCLEGVEVKPVSTQFLQTLSPPLCPPAAQLKAAGDRARMPVEEILRDGLWSSKTQLSVEIFTLTF